MVNFSEAPEPKIIPASLPGNTVASPVKHSVKEEIFNNRSMELDQIRIAMDGLLHESDEIQHWCTLSGITLKECYTEAIKRATMVKRDTEKLKQVLKSIVAGD